MGYRADAAIIWDDVQAVYDRLGRPKKLSYPHYARETLLDSPPAKSTLSTHFHTCEPIKVIAQPRPEDGQGIHPSEFASKGARRDVERMERYVAKMHRRIRELEGGKSHRPVKGRPHTVIAIGDLHMPWHCERWLTEVYKIIKEVRPSHVVQMGDAYDHFSQSRFPGTRNLMTPQAEVNAAREGLEAFWATIRKIVPQATCTQLLGNHDDRPLSRLFESAPMLEAIFSRGHLLELYQFDGVDLVESSRDRLELDGVLYMHGTGKLGTHCRALSQNVVRAHDHQPGLITQRVGDRVFWEASAGYCAEPESPVFGYVKHSRYAKWARAVLKIERGQPHFYYDLEDQG